MFRPTFLSLVALALAIPDVDAQTVIVWRGTPAAWNAPGQWSTNTVPTSTETAQVSSGTAQVNSPASVGNLILDGGNIGGNDVLTLLGASSIWTSGALVDTGTLKIASGATLTLSGSANKQFYRGDGATTGGHVIENLGTFRLGGTGNLLGGDGAQFLNRSGGLFLFEDDVILGHTGGGAGPSFNNAGTFRKSGGTGTATISSTAFTTSGRVEVLANTGTLAFTSGVTSNAGIFDAAANTRIAFSGGQTFNNHTAFTGTGTNAIEGGTTTVDGAISSQNLIFAGGSLHGTATISGLLLWTAGDWIGTGTLKIASGGTLTLSGSSDKRLYRGDGATTGGRTLENFGDIVWTGAGQIFGGDGAQIVNQSGSRFLIQNDSVLLHSGGALPTFINSGLVRKTGTSGLTGFGTPFVNQAGGTVDVQTGTISYTGSVTSNGGAFVTAAGTSILFSGGQAFNGGTSFTAGGAIRIDSGNTSLAGNIAAGGLEFAGGSLFGSATVSGPMVWSGGLWTEAATISFASGSSLTLSGPGTKTLNRGDGATTGGRVLQTAGTLTWLDAGGIVGGDGASISVLSGGLFEIRNDSTYSYSGGGSLPYLVNAGTVRKLASTGTTTFSNVTLLNSGVLDLQTGSIVISGSGGLSNSGTVSIANGTTLTSSASGGTNTAGIFTIASGGALRFTSGTNTFSGGSIGGAGTATVDGGTLLMSGTYISGTLNLVSGTIGGAGTISVGTVGPTPGRFVWSGGSLTDTGTLSIGANGYLLINGSTEKRFYRGDGATTGGRIISNFGNVTWADNGSILGGDGGQIFNFNSGIFDITGDARFGYTNGGAIPTFNNQGILRKSAGSGATEFSSTLINTGTVETLSGTIRISGGGSADGQFKAVGGEIVFSDSFTFNDGADLLGTNYIRATGGTMAVSGGVVTLGSSGDHGRFSLEGAMLSGSGTFLVAALGEMDWISGGIASTGTLRVASGGQLRITSGGDHAFYRGDGATTGGRVIDNYGTVAWSGGALLGGDGGQFINRVGALFEVTGGTTLGHTGGGAMPSFDNAGTFRKTGGGFLNVSSTNFTTSGKVEAADGNINFDSGVTSNAGLFQTGSSGIITFAGGQSFNTGTRFLGDGISQIAAGDTYLNGAITADYLRIAGGNVHGTATITGALEWAGGNLIGTGTLTIADSSSLFISGTGDRLLYRGDGATTGGRILENYGFIYVDNTGNLLGGDGAQILNRSTGIIGLQNDRTIGHTGGGAAPGIVNQGDFAKLGGSGTSTVAVPFHNNGGVIAVGSGTLAFTSTFTNTNGNVTLFDGGQLTVPGVLEMGTGNLVGTGTITAPGGVRTNGGVFPEQITIIGSLSLLSSSIYSYHLGSLLGGAAAGIEVVDAHAVSGSSTPLYVDGQVNLGGSLHVHIVPTFRSSITPADTFTLLSTSNALLGTFSNVAPGQRLMVNDGGSFLVNYGTGSLFGATNVVLSDFQAIPEPSTYALLALGAAMVFIFRRRSRP